MLNVFKAMQKQSFNDSAHGLLEAAFKDKEQTGKWLPIQ